jgi:hypothetical protein
MPSSAVSEDSDSVLTYKINKSFCLFVWFGFFETGFLCLALAVLELTLFQAGFQLRNPPASPSQVLGLKACATTTQRKYINLKKKKKEF